MVHKRQFGCGGGSGEGSEPPNKHPRVITNVFKGLNNARVVEELLPNMEFMIRRWVREEVSNSIERLQRFPQNQFECSGSRALQLRFLSNLPEILFTGSKVVAEDKTRIQIVLYDPISGATVISGPLSSIKVTITVLDADFGIDDDEDWTRKDFDRKTVQNREGKRPLVTGDLTVVLQNGVGYIGDFIFTDNSSWIRSGRFRLGAKANEKSIREGMSNAFKVKDHRGESYQKHYPPSMYDEVWRLEKIAKDGTFHKKLTELGVKSVGDFLRRFVMDPVSLRNMLPNTSTKAWDKITMHASTCEADETKLVYRSAHGTVLFFDSVYRLLGASFDGKNCLSVDNLDFFQKRLVNEQKQHAYKNRKDWVQVYDSPSVSYPFLLPSTAPASESFDNPRLFLQDNTFPEQDHQLEMQMNNGARPSISPPYNCEVEQDTSGSFEIGESSHQIQGGFNPSFRDSFGLLINSLCEDNSWLSGGNNYYLGGSSHLPTDDIPVDNSFLKVEESSSVWQENRFSFGSTSRENGFFSNSGMLIPTRKGRPTARWCKVLAPLKWWILARRNVAAKEWKRKRIYGYMD